MNIELRISKLRAELQNLNNSHDVMVQDNQRINQEFQRQVTNNQSRFQQLVGAIAELENMQKEAADNNGDEPTPAPENRLNLIK